MPVGRHHGPRSFGPYRQMTPQWKKRVQAALAHRQVAEQWLADQVTAHLKLKKPLKRWTIDKLLREQQGSTLVDAICAILELPQPLEATPEVTDEIGRELLTIVRAMPRDQQLAWISLLKQRSS